MCNSHKLQQFVLRLPSFLLLVGHASRTAASGARCFLSKGQVEDWGLVKFWGLTSEVPESHCFVGSSHFRLIGWCRRTQQNYCNGCERALPGTCLAETGDSSMPELLEAGIPPLGQYPSPNNKVLSIVCMHGGRSYPLKQKGMTTLSANWMPQLMLQFD